MGNHAGTLPELDITYLQLNHATIQPINAITALCPSLIDSTVLVSRKRNTSLFQVRLSLPDCPLLLFLEQKVNIDWQDFP